MTEPVALYDEADKLKDAGKLEEAAAKLYEALSVDLNYALAHSALAVVLQKLGRHEEAIQHARKVCEIEPDDPFSYTALSVTYQRVRRHEQHGLHPHGGRRHGAEPDPARPALSRVGTAHHFSFIFGGRCPPYISSPRRDDREVAPRSDCAL